MSDKRERGPFDAVGLARELSLDPERASGGECRIRCPLGCDDGRRRGDFGASLHVAADDRCGLWSCNRCNNGGHLAVFAGRGWEPSPAPPDAWQPEDRSQAIDMPKAWASLEAVRYRHAGEIRRWATARGWEEEIAAAVAESPDVAWAGPNPIGCEAGDRLRDHAVYAQRPLLVVIRDAQGAPVSAMRRCAERTPSDGQAKSKASARRFCPTDSSPIFGSIPEAVAALEGGATALLIVEGEPDYLAAQALARLGRLGEIRAVLGVPAAHALRGLGEALGRALVEAGRTRARIVLVPHLGDTGRQEAQVDKGLKAMQRLGAALTFGDARALVSTCHLRPLVSGKADLADVMERRGSLDLARQLREVVPRIVTDGVASWVWSDDLRWEGAETTNLLARRCWPVSLTRRVEGGEHGLRYRYVTAQGAVRYGVLSAASWADKNAAQSAGRAAAEAGVEILAGHGADWAMALGQWAGRERRHATVAVVSRPGWHRDDVGQPVYVNGANVLGADWIYEGEEARSMRAGTLEDWRRGVAELGNTSGLLLSLGCSLAGALVEPLSLPLFMVHLAGRSSSGKTSAGRLAAAVWTSPREVLTYNGTGKGLTLATEAYNGACVVLDEIKEISPQDLAKVIHTITDGRSRTMAQQTGDRIRDVRRWALTGVSTGEITVAEALGTQAQGGQAVRAIDLRVELGEVTRDAAHAVALARWLERNHGVLGDVWVERLRGWDDARWMGLMREVDSLADIIAVQDDPELGRVVRSLALCCQALVEAREWLGLELDRTYAEQLLRWAVERVRVERGAVTSPETRALRSLRELIESAPALFPDENAYRSGQTQRVVGVWLLDGHQDDGSPFPKPCPSGALAVTEGTLKACEALKGAGVGPRAFLAWLHAQGLSDGGSWRRVGGKGGRWHRLDLDACNTSEAS